MCPRTWYLVVIGTLLSAFVQSWELMVEEQMNATIPEEVNVSRRCFPYQLQWGDTIERVSNFHQTTPAQILKDNPGLNVERFELFQSIQICNGKDYTVCAQDFPAIECGYVDRWNKTVALTFDVGVEALINARQVLELLHEEGVPGTFFITTRWQGNRISQFPTVVGLIRQMVADGHLVASGMTERLDLTNMDGRDIQHNVTASQEDLDALHLQTTNKLIRAPFSSPFVKGSPLDVMRVGELLGSHALHVCWSFNAWGTTPEQLAEQVDQLVREQRTGPVVFEGNNFSLLGPPTNGLKLFIRKLRNANYTFLTIEDYVIQKYGITSDKVVRKFQRDCRQVVSATVKSPDFTLMPPAVTTTYVTNSCITYVGATWKALLLVVFTYAALMCP